MSPMSRFVLLWGLSMGLLSSVARAETGAEGSVPPLQGTWRLDMQIYSFAHIPVLGETEIRSRTVYRAEVTGSPEAPTVSVRVCRMDARSPRAIATTRIPQAFVDAVPQRVLPAKLSPEGDAWAFHLDLTPNHLGYDPKRAPDGLPRDTDHPAVVDFEGDGHPGGTFLLDAPLFGEVQIYVVQHAHTLLDGTWTGGDVWGGRASLRTFDQRSIGASNRLFAANAKVTVDATRSRFQWTRVPEGTSCKALRDGLKDPGGTWL